MTDLDWTSAAGSILCRFESVGPPFVFMRVVRVIEPVRMADGYNGPIGKPLVGKYIKFNGKPMMFLNERKDGGEAKYSLWRQRGPQSRWGYLWDYEL